MAFRSEGEAPALVWLRQDLRVHDNAALHAAVASKRPVLPVHILDDEAPGPWAHGGAHRWWLHGSLAALGHDFDRLGAKLVLRRGDARREIVRIAEETGAAELHVGTAAEPWARTQLDGIEADLKPRNVAVKRHRTATLFDPAEIRTGQGGVYGVFTPFAHACRKIGVHDEPLPAPARIAGARAPRSDALDDWNLRPAKPDWAGGLRESWAPGEEAAAKRLRGFVRTALSTYQRTRDLPGEDGTSMLSPHLHWGETSPLQVWRAACDAMPEGGKGLEVFLGELLWREFSQYLLWHSPSLPDQPLRPQFAAMEWRRDAAAFRAWTRGQTGVPIVDAGMRQLWHTGWMHNRVRMIVASFLIKHLLIDWREGERWFWDTLVDGDLAANSAQWQWVAGCGADAAPFFRIFNPVLQGRKFDPDGAYVRRWVPEIAHLPDRFLHAPWEAGTDVRVAPDFVRGKTYPEPIVDLAAARQRALDTFRTTVKTQR